MNLLKVSAQIGPTMPGLEFKGFHGTSPHRYGRITARIADKSHVLAVAHVAEVDARRGGFGGQTASTRPKWRFVNF
jgi:hypothetical protein